MTDGFYHLELDKGESLLLLEDVENQREIQLRFEKHQCTTKISLAENEWKISVHGVGINGNSMFPKKSKGLPLLGIGDELERFSGTIIYETQIEVKNENVKSVLLIEDANEIVTLYVNNKKIDTRISYPYQFELSNCLKKGSNDIKVEVVNNLGRYMQDFLSQYITFESLGLIGEIDLYSYDAEEK
ncbi:hypothetical protein A5865_001273 [Enterococcus sp. 12E11_DIV0728]|nr:hypothetical protein A5865_001273 [Enterococcus sp. 12E11_DIV0728]